MKESPGRKIREGRWESMRGTTEEFGKPVGSDRSREKSTFVTALGLEGSGALVEQLTEEAVSALNGFPQPDFLIWLARELASRRK